jgi:uncharacterized protein YbaR (Trm112 family)
MLSELDPLDIAFHIMTHCPKCGNELEYIEEDEDQYTLVCRTCVFFRDVD